MFSSLGIKPVFRLKYSVVSFFQKTSIMNKSTKFIGIDISKDSFDIWCNEDGYENFSNNLSGFKKFKKTLCQQSWCVMEYTGSYYQKLAMFLYENNISVSVVNPLTVKRFIQMKRQQNKTDKSDARMIALYAEDQSVEKWIPKPKYIEECKSLNNTIVLYFKQSTALKNKLHSLQSRGTKGTIIFSLKRQIKNIKKEIAILENQMELLIKENEPEMLTNITGIPGIGKKTAMLLIASTGAFEPFSSSKQLSAFFGLAPADKTSGTSLINKSRITKKGNPIVRNHLFMCSFTACENNMQCKNLYGRIVNKGKSKKLALIAVCNKLLKQAYAVAKSGLPYDPYYKSSLCPQ